MSTYERLTEWFSNQSEPSNLNIPGFEMSGGHGSETEEAPDIEIEEHGTIVGQEFGIAYEDAKHNISKRVISVHGLGVASNGDTLLKAHCYLRNAMRHFIVGRIKEVFDADGVVLDGPKFFARYDITPGTTSAKTEKAGSFSHALDSMRVLCALSLSDDEMHPDEVQVIVSFAVRVLENEGTFPDDDEIQDLEQMIKRMRPRQGVVVSSLKRLARCSDQHRERFKRAVRNLIDADGILAQGEFDMLMELQEILE